MAQSKDINRRIVLAARPKGAPTPSDFRLETAPSFFVEAVEVLDTQRARKAQ